MFNENSSSCGLAIRSMLSLLLATGMAANAEEGGSGHYFPGSMSSFIDGVPPEETIIARLNVLGYDGSFDSDIAVPIAGLAALNVDVESTAVALTGLWRPPLDLGDNWSFAAAITVPWVELTVEADVFAVQDPQLGTVRRSDSVSGLGDILLLPLMLNYNVSPALNYNFRVGIYAPTGEYNVGELANAGKNFWSVEPTAAMIYLDPKTGRELSAFAGITLNQENGDTDYESGSQAHLEVTATQHFPLWGGLGGTGITGFWYQQVTGDSGDGANFGDFKARAAGIGPAISWVGKAAGMNWVAEFKWLHESKVKRRAEGDTLFLKVVSKF